MQPASVLLHKAGQCNGRLAGEQITTNELPFVSGLDQVQQGNISAVCMLQNDVIQQGIHTLDRSCNHHAEAQDLGHTAALLGGTKAACIGAHLV